MALVCEFCMSHRNEGKNIILLAKKRSEEEENELHLMKKFSCSRGGKLNRKSKIGNLSISSKHHIKNVVRKFAKQTKCE